MEKYISQILDKYFRTLSLIGSFKQSDLEKMMVVVIIDELVKDNFRCYISQEDIKLMENVLNKYYGTSCSVPFVSCLNCN